MAKRNVVTELRYCNGWWRATLQDRETDCVSNRSFLYYTKREVLYRLRNIYDAVVPRHVEKGDVE